VTRATTWRDHVESTAIALALAATFKVFLIEAYRIPSGSMQPTLLGNEETSAYDRILVDKITYRVRDPERWEVAVFKFPLDRSKAFVKRIVGLPGEEFRIELGDLWTRADAREPWRILRRPEPVMRDVWKPLDRVGDDAPSLWSVVSEQSSSTRWPARTAHLTGTQRARFGDGTPIRDDYTDGYPAALLGKVRPRGSSGAYLVGDLRVEGSLRPSADCPGVAIVLYEEERRYVFELPGPGAGPDECPRIWFDDPSPRPTGSAPVLEAAQPWRLPADARVRFVAQNLDDRLTLRLEGFPELHLDVPAALQPEATVALECRGGEVAFDDLQVYRDIYYLEGRTHEFAIPADSYLVLGDNTQDSADSRMWSAYSASWAGEGPEGSSIRQARGYDHGRENPARGLVGDAPTTFFRDEWGERYVMLSEDFMPLMPADAPFVPRELILGRAFAVFWPIAPWRDLVRPRWIH
jgi:signal peptidase I